MTLSLYLARRYLAYFLMVLCSFAALSLLLEFVEEIRGLDPEHAGFSEAMQLGALKLPGTLYRILPLVSMIASVAYFVGLARSSEMVVIRAAGRSVLRMLVAPVAAILVIGAASVAAINPIVAATSKQYELVAERYTKAPTSVASLSGEGLWLRQTGAEGPLVIRAARTDLDGTRFIDVSFVGFSTEGGPVRRIDAAEARLTKGAWEIDKAKEWRFVAGGNPERDAVQHERLTLATDLTPEGIRDGFGAPASIQIWELPAFIAALQRAGISARKHQVWMQMELAMPLLLVAMMLIAASLTLRHARLGRVGVMALGAIVLGFAVFFLRNLAQIMGESGQIPAALAAWAPPAVAILLSVGLILHQEEG